MATSPPPLPEARRLRPRRWLLLGGIAVALAAGAWWLRADGPGGVPLRCMLNEWTGLHCPGCGMTRAAHATLGGRLGAAFAHNPVGMVLLPLGLTLLAYEALFWACDRRPPWRLRVGGRGAMALVVLVIGFGVLRNLPWWPFTLLAP